MEKYIEKHPGPVMTAGGDTTVACSDTPPRRRFPLCLDADEGPVASVIVGSDIRYLFTKPTLACVERRWPPKATG